MTIAELSRRATQPAHSVVSALGLALLIVGVEYLARHFALLWLPAIGALRVNDVGAGGQLAGLLATSVLFSLKHALSDASLGRTLALTGSGLVMGLLALRHGWRAAALAHAIANTLSRPWERERPLQGNIYWKRTMGVKNYLRLANIQRPVALPLKLPEATTLSVGLSGQRL